jgi:hypothetical protein
MKRQSQVSVTYFSFVSQIDKISPHGVEIQRFGLDESETVPADVIVEVCKSEDWCGGSEGW